MFDCNFLTLILIFVLGVVIERRLEITVYIERKIYNLIQKWKRRKKDVNRRNQDSGKTS